MTPDEWLRIGVQNGWCSPIVCATHDGLPSTEEEDIEAEDGDPCIPVIRPYEDAEVKAMVEKNHPPSVWRNAYA